MSEDLRQRVRETVAACFGLAPEDVLPGTAQDDLAAWDSVGHLNLMLSVEDVFGVTLDVPDMEKLTSVEAIVGFLEAGRA